MEARSPCGFHFTRSRSISPDPGELQHRAGGDGRLVLPEHRLNPKLDDGLVNNDDVMTQEFAQYLVLHGDVRLAADVVAELRLDHAERALDVAPLVVPLEELVPPEVEVV